MTHRRTIWGVGSALLGLIAAAACLQDTPAMFIVQNSTLDSSCSPSRSVSGEIQGAGALDLTVGRTYDMFLLVENLMSPSGSASLGGGAGGAYEGNRVTVTNALISILGPGGLGVRLPSDQRIPIAGTLEPGGDTVVTIETIGPVLGEQLSAALPERGTTVPIQVNVQFEGVTTSGTDVESNVFTYPINVCRGCLLEFPPESVNEDDPIPNCHGPSADEDEETLIFTCNPGQDDPFSCRVCHNLLESKGENAVEVAEQCEPAQGR